VATDVRAHAHVRIYADAGARFHGCADISDCTATSTVVPTSTTAPSGNVGGTQTAVVAATQTAAANLTTTPVATTAATNTAIIIVVTNTPQPTKAQPGRLPNTGITDGFDVWQNQPLVVVMAVTGLLGLAFLFYSQRN
jgi:hypothetical protein